MAYLRVIAKGAIGTFDNWSTSVAFGIVGLAPDVPDQELVDDMAARLAALSAAGSVPTALKAIMGGTTSLNAWRVEKRDEAEDLLSVGEASSGSPATGSVGNSKTPQDAIVLSLRTTLPGARGRGRMYWPAQGAVLGTEFVLSSPTPAAMAADAKVFIQTITTQLNAAYAAASDTRTVRVAVRSQTDHVCRDVTQIQVGNYLDTQRRRRDKFRETYASVVF